MRALGLLFSPRGQLRQRPFVVAVIVVYAAGLASQLLTSADVITRAGLWPFAIAQALLIWIWFVLHAKRLREARRTIGLAIGVGVLYTLAVILLVLLASAFANSSGGEVDTNANASGALGLLLFLFVVATLTGSPQFGFLWIMVAVLTALALVPVAAALILSLWAALLPSAMATEAKP
jgi:hypothetical protein